MNNTFSIVLPTYNRANILENAIMSVLEQDYGDFELIIIDDGSIDQTSLILRDYDDDRIITVWDAHHGVSVARNTGLHEAKGKYLVFIDSDNEWLSDYLSSMYNEMQRVDDGNAVYCDVLTNYKLPNGEDVFNYDFSYERILRRPFIDLGSICVLRELVISNKMYFNPFIKRQVDWEWQLRLLMHTEFKRFPKPLYRYNLRTDSITNTEEIDRYNEITLDETKRMLRYVLSKKKKNVK